jgi:hypothetical protein
LSEAVEVELLGQHLTSGKVVGLDVAGNAGEILAAIGRGSKMVLDRALIIKFTKVMK